MKTLSDVYQKLRKAKRKDYVLYVACNFISLLLITAYAAMMFSPTVLNTLPEGGDSRKQMTAIFVLACFGCAVFTVYAASLFYRMKSREIGTLMALGASKKQLAPALLQEVISLGGAATLAGAACGIPFAWLIWQCFRLFVVDSPEMVLHFNFLCLAVSAVFIVLVLLCAFLLGVHYVNRTNIMDIIHEEHKAEPIREVNRLCGPIGIVLLLAGAIAGYSAPSIYMNVFSAYPPAWINILYAPVFVGLYMILLHTVVRGWRSTRKHPYKGIISRSMMKFQGKQTVNNMLVVTVLIAGACFGLFYTPMMGTGQIIETKNRPFDYLYKSRLDQNLPDQSEIAALAGQHGLTTKDWMSVDYAGFAMDGYVEVEEKGGKFHDEYQELVEEGYFFSESAYEDFTGQEVSVPQGSYYAVNSVEETASYMLNNGATVLTNMCTGEKLQTEFAGYLHFNMLVSPRGSYVLNDSDYAKISQGLTDEWKGRFTRFNIDQGTDSYVFAYTLFNRIVDSFDSSCELPVYYDRVTKTAANQKGEEYWGDTDIMTKISFDARDSSDFRQYWTYMPQFRILDQTDYLRTFAVFLMMFIFIAIVCIMSSLIICYTRCVTIASNNRYVFDDLKRLGASPAFLKKEVRNQSSKVFSVPSLVGMGIMYLLYCMIMYANDGALTSTEIAGLGVCLFLVGLLGLLVWTVYRATLKKMLVTLGISR